MASLNRYTGLLGQKYAKHLLRRASFVYTKSVIDQFALLTPDQALNLLLEDQSLTLPLPYDPTPTTSPDGFWTEPGQNPATFKNQGRKSKIVSGWWWYNAINSPTLKYKLSHFLSTRFTVDKHHDMIAISSLFYDHVRLLLFYSYGNYKTFAKKMSIDNVMLDYLSNSINTKTAPNENYAREFFELFTIGKGLQIDDGNYTTYTEHDVVQAAKIFTGFTDDRYRRSIDSTTGIPRGIRDFAKHDVNPKVFSAAFNNTTINPATNSAGMEAEVSNFVEMVFNQMATAKNICRKLYIYFVKSNITDEVETDIITPLAELFYNNNYEIAPIIRKLLTSKHFYDLDDANTTDETIGGIIKSPLQQLCEMVTYFKATIPDPTTNPEEFYITFYINFVEEVFSKATNMTVFSPDNVAGHLAYYQSPSFDKNWIAASTFLARVRIGGSLIEGRNRISGNSNIITKINIVLVVKNGDLFSNPSDPFILTSEICNAVFAQVPNADRVNYFMNSFLLQGLDTFYWTDAWNSYLSNDNLSVVEPRLKLMVSKILSAPESQIF